MARCAICGLLLDGPFAACPSCDAGSQWVDEDEVSLAGEGDAERAEDDAVAVEGWHEEQTDDRAEEVVPMNPPANTPKKRRGCPPGGWPKKAVSMSEAESSVVLAPGLREAMENLVVAPEVIRPTRLEESPVFQEMVKEWERLESEIIRMRERQHFLKELAHRAGVQFMGAGQF